MNFRCDNLKDLMLKSFLMKGFVGFALLFSSCARAAETDSVPTPRITVSGDIDGFGYVDMGLPTLWATANVGAKAATDEGEVVAWAELVSNVEFDWHTYKYSGDSCTTITKYCMMSEYGLPDALAELLPEDDAATANWGANWHTPTQEDFDALRLCCAWQWIDDFDSTGVCGLYGVSKINGNSIFLPASEYEETKDDPKTYFQGWYWSASLGMGTNGTALQFVFQKGGKLEDIGLLAVPRCYGRLIRPVSTKK